MIASNLLWKRSAGKCNPLPTAVILLGVAVAAPASASNIHNVEFGFGLNVCPHPSPCEIDEGRSDYNVHHSPVCGQIAFSPSIRFVASF